MKAKFAALFLVLLTSHCFGRAVMIIPIEGLMERSAVAFVGKVTSIKPSGMTTELTYPTWKDVVFEWLTVEVEVIEPIKGTKVGQSVKTYMLSTRGAGPMFNPPGMVDPKVGQHHLLFLLPTKIDGTFAAITAPFDDDQSIFFLDRSFGEYGNYREDPKTFDKFPEYRARYEAIWSLVDDEGRITPDGAKSLRERFKTQIATPAKKDAIVHLKWKKQTANGWDSNVPADSKAPAKSQGAVTKP